MRVGLTLLATVALSFATRSNATPMFIMSAPNPLRVGSAERIYVEAQDYSGDDIFVTIKLLKFPTKDREITTTDLILHSANEFKELKEITIPADSLDKSEKQFLYLQATFRIPPEPEGTLLEKVVLVSFKPGYIVIQTDKTLYNPKQQVKYRVFTLGPGMTPVATPIIVELKTPEGTTVKREDYQTTNGWIPAAFPLPEPVSIGNWKVVAKFLSAQHEDTEYSATFEVKEYVLPDFEVTLSISEPYFHVDRVELPVDIEARYLFDMPVRGNAIVVVGVIDGGNRISLPESLQRVELEDGRAMAMIRNSYITPVYPDINTLIHKSLFVTVSVFTDTGSDMVTSERLIPIVSSPYKIDLKKTPLYFKPDFLFLCTVYLTNIDGSPAEGVLVEVEALSQREEARTQANGVAKIHINTRQELSDLQITVRTKDPKLKDNEQATQSKTIRPYRTKHNSMNYLHISHVSTNDQYLQVHLRLGKSPAANVPKEITYLILSKGRIVHFDRVSWENQNTLALSPKIIKDMLPSFRFVAYYHVGGTEVVSDSVWVDVTESCMGQLSVIAKPSTKLPGKSITFQITGDPGAKVGLVAVDKAVYILNNKHRLTQPKIWGMVENEDIGCTTGSGQDSMGVFYDAGLVFAFKSPGAEGHAEGTPEKTEVGCPVQSRRRRAVTITHVKTTLANQYSTDLERECCMDGMRKNILDYTCERRSTYINDGPMCINAFLRCCTEFSTKQEEARVDELTLARSQQRVDEDDKITLRTSFDESWLWHDLTLPSCPQQSQCDKVRMDKRSSLPGSITNWQITAISLSETLGICVADPLTVVVQKKFFVDLKLPYSVAFNEQIQIKAIIHNYLEEPLQVRVTLIEAAHICSAATKKRNHRVSIRVASMSSSSVPFVIIPMRGNQHTITVTAVGYDTDNDVLGRDGIAKELNVVSEGVPKTIHILKKELYPSRHGGSQTERIVIPRLDNRMPNTEAKIHVSVTGEPLARTITGAISGESLGELIQAPYGCGEQNMISMTFPLIATYYLDSTNQWDKVGPERRNEAVDYINLGYMTQLAYHKSDGSFVRYRHPEKEMGSTWLTAYVVKVFAMAGNYIFIDTDVMCKAAEFLVQRQRSNGTFEELAQVYSIMGEILYDDKDSTLTAFVLIAMQRLPEACMNRNLQESMTKAQRFLEGRIHTLSTPYSVAITSYALANEGRLNKHILFQQSRDRTHWDVGRHYSTLEATSYALLALLKADAVEEARPISSWLSNQGFIGGGWAQSTQANIMVFHAIAEFMIQSKKIQEEHIDLNVHIAGQGRSNPKNISFTQDNYYHTRSKKADLNDLSTVVATGTGHASLMVTLEYFAMPEDESEECTNFELNVQLIKDDMVSSNLPTETYRLVISVRFKGDRKAGMTIVDIGMLTGFEVELKDLKQLSTGRERYIEMFEMDNKLSKGSLILYLKEVSHNDMEKIVLRMYNNQENNLIQPAAVTVYEYYVKENRCVKFYHPVMDGTLAKPCHDDVCHCAEATCSYQRKNDVDESRRLDKICEYGVHYAYKGTVVSITNGSHSDLYEMELETIKPGSDVFEDGAKRMFLAQRMCRNDLDLKVDSTYLLMGIIDTSLMKNGKQLYVLGEQTWIEYIPTTAECQQKDGKYRATCIGMEDLSNIHLRAGCYV